MLFQSSKPHPWSRWWQPCLVAALPGGRRCSDSDNARVPWHCQQTSLCLRLEQAAFWEPWIQVPTQSLPCWSNTVGKHPSPHSSELRDLEKWVSFTLVGERERGGNDSDHDGKFLKAGQIQLGHRGTQESFPASGIWYGEQPHVTDKPPELTSQDLGSTSTFSACWLCYLGKITYGICLQ